MKRDKILSQRLSNPRLKYFVSGALWGYLYAGGKGGALYIQIKRESKDQIWTVRADFEAIKNGRYFEVFKVDDIRERENLKAKGSIISASFGVWEVAGCRDDSSRLESDVSSAKTSKSF